MSRRRTSGEIIVKGDASDVSVWDDSDERSGTPAPLHNEYWYDWYQALLAKRDLHKLVGGAKVIRAHRLMLVPPHWPSDTYPLVRGMALGWAITEYGKPVNLVRRFLDDKQPRYMGLKGRGLVPYLWPDRGKMGRELVLVAGMRDACWARSVGFDAYTTTNGVENWPDIERSAYERRFVVCFDAGEQRYAERLAQRLRAHRAASVTVCVPPDGFKDLADLAEVMGPGAVRSFLTKHRQAGGK